MGRKSSENKYQHVQNTFIQLCSSGYPTYVDAALSVSMPLLYRQRVLIFEIRDFVESQSFFANASHLGVPHQCNSER